MALQKDPSREAAIQPYRTALVKDSGNLAVWQHPAATMLYYIAVAFELEIRDRAVAVREVGTQAAFDNFMVAVANLEVGLDVIVHELYKRSPVISLASVPKQFDEDLLKVAQEALPYGHSFEAVRMALDDVPYGTRRLDIHGGTVRLPYAEQGATELQAAMSILGGKNDPTRPNPITLFELDKSDRRENLMGIIRSAYQPSGPRHIEYIPDLVLVAFARSLAERAVNISGTSPTVAIGGYSLAQFRRFYRVLYRLSAVRQAMCSIAPKDNPGQPVGSLPLIVTSDQLRTQLCGVEGMPVSTFERIIDDLTYDASSKWAHLEYQPLLPIRADRFLIAPTAITTSEWERNLLKLWSHKHQSDYSALVASKKHSSEEELAAAFRVRGFIATAGRKLKTIGGRDADVAVYDHQANYLLLLQVKWLLQPGASHEAREAEEHLDYAAVQATDVESAVSMNRHAASSVLFDPGKVQLNDRTTIRSLIVGRGHTGLLAGTQRGIPVVDFYRVVDHLKTEPAGTPLQDLVVALEALMSGAGVQAAVLYAVQQFQIAATSYEIQAFKRRV